MTGDWAVAEPLGPPIPAGMLSVAALWVAIEFEDLLRVRNRSFWGSGRPRGPRRPLQKVGGEALFPFARVCGAPGAAQTPEMTDFRPLENSKSLPKYSHVRAEAVHLSEVSKKSQGRSCGADVNRFSNPILAMLRRRSLGTNKRMCFYYFGGSQIPSKAPPRSPDSTPRAQTRGPRAIPNDSRVGQNSANKYKMGRNVRHGYGRPPGIEPIHLGF
jgi:hypothetical protein